MYIKTMLATGVVGLSLLAPMAISAEEHNEVFSKEYAEHFRHHDWAFVYGLEDCSLCDFSRMSTTEYGDRVERQQATLYLKRFFSHILKTVTVTAWGDETLIILLGTRKADIGIYLASACMSLARNHVYGPVRVDLAELALSDSVSAGRKLESEEILGSTICEWKPHDHP